MAILGLTDQQSLKPRFPLVGKLRKGGEKPANGIGKDLDHFRFTSNRPEVIDIFAKQYGTTSEELQSLFVYLPFPTPSEVFETWKEAYTAGAFQHRCDGQTMTLWRDEHGVIQKTPKPCVGGCKEVGRLTVILPKLWEAGVIGYVTMETGSLNDLVELSSTLQKTYEERCETGRDLRKVGFILRRVLEPISTPKSQKERGKRTRRDKWLVKIEPTPEWSCLQLQIEGKAPSQLTGKPVNALSSGSRSLEDSPPLVEKHEQSNPPNTREPVQEETPQPTNEDEEVCDDIITYLQSLAEAGTLKKGDKEKFEMMARDYQADKDRAFTSGRIPADWREILSKWTVTYPRPMEESK